MKLRALLTKGEEIRFISHLDYAALIERAIRRAKLPAAIWPALSGRALRKSCC